MLFFHGSLVYYLYLVGEGEKNIGLPSLENKREVLFYGPRTSLFLQQALFSRACAAIVYDELTHLARPSLIKSFPFFPGDRSVKKF